jgi:glycosyltransferase involved in cell wall biosynthesis
MRFHVVQGDGGTWWEQARLPAALAGTGVDVLFAAGYTAPLRCRCPMVLAVYDVSFFAHPEWFSFREGARRRWITKRSAQRAEAVVTISDFSSPEIVRWLGVDRRRIVLAPPGGPPARPSSRDPREPMVLFVGSLFNRRHIPELVRAFAAVRRRVPEARLVLVGDNRTTPRLDPLQVARECGLADAVAWHTYVPDARLEDLYGRARVFAFLSEYEGFGMTPLEAIAHRVPAVVLDTAVARDVYADGARYVSLDETAIADMLIRLLTDEVEHERVLRAGLARVHEYSWSRTADTIQRVLENATARAAD